MKKAVSLLIVFLLVISVFSIAQSDQEELAEAVEETSEDCNFGCKVWQFFFGNPVNRAGKGWFDRGNLVGMADNYGNTGNFGPCSNKNKAGSVCFTSKGNLLVFVSEKTGIVEGPSISNDPGTSSPNFKTVYTWKTLELGDDGELVEGKQITSTVIDGSPYGPLSVTEPSNVDSVHYDDYSPTSPSNDKAKTAAEAEADYQAAALAGTKDLSDYYTIPTLKDGEKYIVKIGEEYYVATANDENLFIEGRDEPLSINEVSSGIDVRDYTEAAVKQYGAKKSWSTSAPVPQATPTPSKIPTAPTVNEIYELDGGDKIQVTKILPNGDYEFIYTEGALAGNGKTYTQTKSQSPTLNLPKKTEESTDDKKSSPAKKSKNSQADKKAATAAGVNLDDKKSIEKFQAAWIAANCPNGVCAAGKKCIGSISGGKCVPDGIAGPETKNAIKAKAKEPKADDSAAAAAGKDQAAAVPATGKVVDGKIQSNDVTKNMALAESYLSKDFVKQNQGKIDWAKVKETGGTLNMPLIDGQSSITATKKDGNSMQEVNHMIATPGSSTFDPEKTKSMIYVNNQPVAEQSLLQGQAGVVSFVGMGPKGVELQTVNLADPAAWEKLKAGETIDYLGTSTTTEGGFLGMGKNAKEVTTVTGQVAGSLQLVNGVATNTNFEEERQVKINPKTGTTEDNDGDYDKDTKKFTPSTGFYTGGGKNYIAEHDTNDQGIKTSTTLLDQSTGFTTGQIKYDAAGNMEWQMVNNQDGTVTLTKPDGSVSQKIPKNNPKAMTAFLDGDKSYAQAQTAPGVVPPPQAQADKPVATPLTLTDPNGQTGTFIPQADGSYVGQASNVDVQSSQYSGKADLTTKVEMVNGEPQVTEIRATAKEGFASMGGEQVVCNTASSCSEKIKEMGKESEFGQFKEQFKQKHQEAQAKVGPSQPVVPLGSAPIVKSEFEPTNPFTEKIKEKQVELSQVGFYAAVGKDKKLITVTFDDAGIIGSDQPQTARGSNGETYLLLGGKWKTANGEELPSDLQKTFNGVYKTFSAKKEELITARMDDLASSDIKWDQLTDTAKAHFGDESKFKKKKSELNEGFSPIIGSDSSTGTRHEAVKYGLSFEGQPVECENGQCYPVTAGYDGTEITLEKGQALTPDEMKQLQVANNELGEEAAYQLKQTLAVQEFNEPIEYDPIPEVDGLYQAIMQTDDYHVEFDYDYSKNPNLKASQAVAAAVPDAAKNPNGYIVMIGGQEAVLANNGEYYSPGNVDENGNPYVEGDRIKMTEDTTISVEKKLQDPDEATTMIRAGEQKDGKPVVPSIDWKTATPDDKRAFVTSLGQDYDQFARDNGVSFSIPGSSNQYLVDAEGRVHTVDAQGNWKSITGPEQSAENIAAEGLKDAEGQIIMTKEQYEKAKEEAKTKTAAAVDKLKDESDLKTAKEKAASGEALTEREKALLAASKDSEVSTLTTVLGSIYVVADSLKNYPAINNLLWGDQDWYQDWKGWADRTFAPMMGSNWFTSAICDQTQNRRDMVPEGKAVIKTVSGTYQAVASIQMEKSDRKAPILCYLNPDQEAAEQFICDKKQVCIEDLCYKDEDRDNEPDEDKALEGYFYKITWGVSAPRDESLTPYVDENGVSVSFNIWLDDHENDKVDAGAKYMYYETGNVAGPIELKNSGMDQGIITKYSDNEYEEACIKWDKAPLTTQGQFSAIAGLNSIGNVCFGAKEIQTGSVDYDTDSSSSSGGTTSSEATTNQNW